MKHTALPWKLGFNDGSGKYSKHKGSYTSSITYNNQLLAIVLDDDATFDSSRIQLSAPANAEFIVKACNNYYEFLELAKQVSDGNFNQGDVIALARTLIEKVER